VSLRERFQLLNITDDVPELAVVPGNDCIPDLVKWLALFQFLFLLQFLIFSTYNVFFPNFLAAYSGSGRLLRSAAIRFLMAFIMQAPP
jgi:hypothetical protein